jgi:hypothetical protein
VIQQLINFIRATTRPGVTYLLTGALVFAIITGRPTGELVGLAGTAIGFWFADRTKTPPPSAG